MGDTAPPSAKRSPVERDLRMKVSLQRVQTSFEQAVGIMTEELEALRLDYAQLQAEHTTLQSDHVQLQNGYAKLQQGHKKLQEEYDSAKDSWRVFRSWWKDKMATKQATQQTPNKIATSSPQVQTPASSSTLMTGRGKSKLTKGEVAMLDTLGLDSTLFGTPGSEKKEPVSTIKVKKEIHDNENELHASPVNRNQRISDEIIQSDQRSEQSKKRSRSSYGEKDRGSPSRRALQEIGNRSASSGHFEEYSPGSLSSHLTIESDSVKKRGKGRYSAGDTSRTINAEFEINPERNGNVPFLHKSVVRDKAERKQMHAHDCECCSGYYKAVGPAAPRRYQDPRKLADQLKAIGGDDEESDAEGERQRQLHRQQISRHRDYGNGPANTPPGYWEVGFPNTQKVEEIRQAAHEEHAKKWKQAQRDPRLIRRGERSSDVKAPIVH